MYSSDQLIEKYWQIIGEESGYKLKYPHILNLHAIIGACLNTQWLKIRGHKIDLRVHPFIIRDSGSGKALSYDQVEKLANLTGLNWKTRTSLTEAGLIGTLRQTRKGIIKIYGDAYETDILGFTEAHILLKASSRSSTTMESLNMILDSKGEIHKRLANGVLEYNTRVSLIISSFPSPLIHEQLNKGFLQRCFIYYENLPLPYYVGIMKWLAENVGTDTGSQVEKNLRKIAKVLKKVKETEFNFDFTYVRSMLDVIPDEFAQIVKGYFDVEILKTFSPRYFNLLLKIACHHASLDFRNEINGKDIEYAKELCLLSFRSVCNFVMDYHQLEKIYYRIDRQFEIFRNKGIYKIKTSVLLRLLRPLKKEQLLHRLEPYVYRGEIKILDEGKIIELVTQEKDKAVSEEDKAVSEALSKLTKKHTP